MRLRSVLATAACLLALGAPSRAGDEERFFEHSGWASARSPGRKDCWDAGAAPRPRLGAGPAERREAPWTPGVAKAVVGVKVEPASAPEPAPVAVAPAAPVEADLFERSGFRAPLLPKPAWVDGPRPPAGSWR
jgi:hypothetical protein